MQARDAVVDTHAPAAVSSQSASDARVQRNLKLAVFGLGFLIFAGLAVIIGRVIYLASARATQPAALAPGMRPEQSLQIPPGAQVRSISLSGNRLAVHYEAAGQAGIAIIDLQTGRTITTVAVQRGGARAPGE